VDDGGHGRIDRPRIGRPAVLLRPSKRNEEEGRHGRYRGRLRGRAVGPPEAWSLWRRVKSRRRSWRKNKWAWGVRVGTSFERSRHRRGPSSRQGTTEERLPTWVEVDVDTDR
jgi:hypothetical protein